MVEATADSSQKHQTSGTVDYQDRLKTFIAWAKENGIEQPDQEFPALFEGGNLVGVRALKPIPYRQSFIKVPYKCVFSATKAKQNPQLKQIIEENPSLFKD